MTDIKLPVRKSVQSCDDQKRDLCEEEEEYYQNQHEGGVTGISSTLPSMILMQAENKQTKVSGCISNFQTPSFSP